jgi:glycosyltransferase involved in cell wall biosynthesis
VVITGSTPKAKDRHKTWITLLGKRDAPTDGVADYCTFLAQALSARGVKLQSVRVPWSEKGWLASLWLLWRDSIDWDGKWVLLQYTAFGWSRRGFPFGVLAAIAIVRSRGARCGIVFHDGSAFSGRSFVEHLRRIAQQWVVRQAHRMAKRSIFTIAPEQLRWLNKTGYKVNIIPIGANVPAPRNYEASQPLPPTQSIATVAVFSVTEYPNAQSEIETVAYVMRQVAKAREGVRLLVFGRGAQAAEGFLRNALQGVAVTLNVKGIIEPDEISRLLAASDALLFVRGQLSGRRGSALAGVACGLPVVGYAGPETVFPITEAGLELAPQGDREALARALTRVLNDSGHRQELRRRSVCAQENYFSWPKIANSFLRILEND